MNPFNVHILGCGSALPTLRHNATCQVVEIRGKYFMVDCGEGTQTQIRRSRIPFNKIQAVFISHLHGDHCFGLIGMISTFALTGRTSPLQVYAPQAFEEYFHHSMRLFCEHIDYEVTFHPLDTTAHTLIYEDRSLTVTSIPLEHRVPCCGFLFKEKPKLPHIRRDQIDFYQIPISQINNIKAGASWTTPEGKVIPHAQLTTPAKPPHSYAYCSDTRYMKNLHTFVKEVDLLYHESTYANDHKANAQRYFHSTAEEAAMVARDANAKRLLLGHFSARYDDETQLLKEAQAIFPNTMLANEGSVFSIGD
ncbi:MAG: ribonuclease Z [Prevotellaceae bacterium]|nr:ribonuclease Z [Prevotellaceae bacterium]